MPSLVEKYFDLVKTHIKRIEQREMESVRNAAHMVSAALISGGNLFVTGVGHASIIAQEVFYRAGGLVLANALFPHGLVLNDLPATLLSRLEQSEEYAKNFVETSPLKKGDVLVIASTAGRNGFVIECAIEARNRGVKVIGITSIPFSSGVSSRHSSGKVLADVVDLVVDDGTPVGDSSIPLDGHKCVGPISTVSGVVLVNLIMLEVMENIRDAGVEVPIFISGNVDGGSESNEKTLQKYRDRIFYL